MSCLLHAGFCFAAGKTSAGFDTGQCTGLAEVEHALLLAAASSRCTRSALPGSDAQTSAELQLSVGLWLPTVASLNKMINGV